ncbi:hypothetical protein BN159_3351 [Streptomyces davaonensis JCM 4913]|uniref:Uncharacterized protein n=1 Tax=Streptomyces davaonensis (strain DSM 101723 / JCM 4913 / KCC S-0913 / 768) TaxID=1214101 RepID=K4R3Q7_STRDJ|nr:hypothetical protein [Streptomyces davaonensis]CCK27730.1 hypothetical protein BN159_3351 [Streptomyces davaonensis JCM 4913]
MASFDQSGWQLQNSRVYNIAGNLTLTEHSGPREFAEVVAELQSRVRKLTDVAEAEREAVNTELAEALAGGEEPAAERLTRLAERLRDLGGSTAAATELGNSVDALAQWAGRHF